LRKYDEEMIGREFGPKWSERRDSAFWRGADYCGKHPFGICSRFLLPHLTHLKASEKLNASLTGVFRDPYIESACVNCSRRSQTKGPYCASELPSKAVPLPTYRAVSMPEHANHKFVLHLDGNSCSNRLQQLLLLGSVVLKQNSYYWEYYYSGMRPFVHYVPFWEASPHDILQAHPFNQPRAHQT